MIKIWVRETGGLFKKDGYRGYLEFSPDEEITLTLKPYEVELILDKLGWDRGKLSTGKIITQKMRDFVHRNIERQLMDKYL